MATALVIGATGYAGRHLVAELHDRGHSVRALVRDRARAERAGPWGAPGLAGLVDEWAVGDVTDPRFTRDVAAGVEVVVSALGVTRQKADPWAVDNLANLAVLHSARTHGARSFTYLNVFGGDRCPAQLTRAKTAFAQTLAASDITAQIINPTGYFSDLMELVTMARRGIVPLFRPGVRINPIHGADLATFTVDRMKHDGTGTWDVGGPQILRWDELARTAFEAVGRRPRTVRIPPAALPPVQRLTSLISPRLADLVLFATWGMTHDGVAPRTGLRRLADFYAENASR